MSSGKIGQSETAQSLVSSILLYLSTHGMCPSDCFPCCVTHGATKGLLWWIIHTWKQKHNGKHFLCDWFLVRISGICAFRNQLITFVGFLLVQAGKKLSIWDLPSIRSQRQMQAVFLRHEGYLGALGALMSYGDDNGENLTLEESEDVSS